MSQLKLNCGSIIDSNYLQSPIQPPILVTDDPNHLVANNESHKICGSEYVCHGCNKLFISAEKYNEHVLINHKNIKYTHEKKENYLYCNMCLYKTKRAQDLKNHSNKHFSDKFCICYLCGKIFKFKSSLEIHWNTQHGLPIELIDNRQYPENRVDKNLRYLLCQEKFLNTKSLKPVDTEHKNDTKKCSVCLYETFISGHLNQHMRAHKNNKLYICFHCGASFKIKATLKEHLNFYRDPKLKSINHHVNPRFRINTQFTSNNISGC